MRSDGRSGYVWHSLGIVLVLGLVAWRAPAPVPTDQLMMERVGQGVIVPGCADLNCFRILVPATLELLPGPSLLRWRAFAVLANAAAALATGRLALALGVAPGIVPLIIWLSALGAGSLSTIYHPYNADPLVLFLAPVMTLWLISGRTVAAGALATVGVFAKEFAAAPLYIAAAASAWTGDRPAFLKRLALAVTVTLIWVVLQILLMSAFGYGYNANPSSRVLSGGYAWYWLQHVTLLTGAFALFSAFGALSLLIPFGWRHAPAPLRALAVGAIPALIAFAYVATPERALWNFYFLAIPIAAIALAWLPAVLQWGFVACFLIANLRLGAQIPEAPASRYALAGSLLIAAAAIVRLWRHPVWPPATAPAIKA